MNLVLSLSSLWSVISINHLLTLVWTIRSALYRRMIPRRCMRWNTWTNKSVSSAMKWEMSSRNFRSCKGWSILSWLICGKYFYWTSEWRQSHLHSRHCYINASCVHLQMSSYKDFFFFGFYSPWFLLFSLMIKQKCCFIVTNKYCLVQLLQSPFSLKSIFF